jgi:sugar phosphate isomerase/epimerase
MKISMSDLAWENSDSTAVYRMLREYAFDGVEMLPTKTFSLDPYADTDAATRFAKRLKAEYHLEISSIQSILYGREENLFGSEKERAILLDYLKQAIRFTAALSCGNLVFGSPKNRTLLKDNFENQYSIAVDFFSELGEYANARHTVLSIEPNPPIYGANFITETEDAFDLVKDVSSKGFQVNVDLGAMINNGESIESVAKNIDKVNHIHISEPYLAPIKRRELHKQLACLEYDKYISVEMKALETWADLESTAEYIRNIFK